MQLHDAGGVQIAEPLERFKAVVLTVDKQVGDVEQEPAVGRLADPAEELRFGQRPFQRKMRRDVLKNQRLATPLDNLAGMICDERNVLVDGANRVEMSEIDFVGAEAGDDWVAGALDRLPVGPFTAADP